MRAFLKLVGGDTSTPPDRLAFYSYIGKVVRSVALDAMRQAQARKRGGDQRLVTLTNRVAGETFDGAQLLAVDDALNTLGNLAPDLKELVEMRYFAGLTVGEISEMTGRSVHMVERDWEKARMLLRQLIEEV